LQSHQPHRPQLTESQVKIFARTQRQNMAKVSPRGLNVSGTDEGRRRQNVFHPNLFSDDFAKDMKEKHENDTEFKKTDNVSPAFAPITLTDSVAKKISATADRFSRTHDAKALTEVVTTVPLPYTIGVCAPGGHGKTFFLRLLKKSLDPDAVEDPLTCEVWQSHQKKAKRIQDRKTKEQLQAEHLFEAEAQETAEQHSHRDMCHGVASEPENAAWYRMKTLCILLWTCLRYLACCYPLIKSQRRRDHIEILYWKLALRVLFFGMWHDLTQSVYVFFRSLYLGHDYQPLPLSQSAAGTVEDFQTLQRQEENTGFSKYFSSKSDRVDGSSAKCNYTPVEDRRAGESVDTGRGGGGGKKRADDYSNAETKSSCFNGTITKEYIFVDFNPAWECVNLVDHLFGANGSSGGEDNRMGRHCDTAHHLLLTLVANIFRAIELRLQQQSTTTEEKDITRKLISQIHENYKSRLRLKQSFRILIDVYGNTLQIRLRVLLLMLFAINIMFAALVVVQHLVIQIFFNRYEIQNAILMWLVPHTTWFFVMNCLLLSLLLGLALGLPVFRFVSLLYGTSDHSYADSMGLLSYLRLSIQHDPYNRDGIVHLIRKELYELFDFLRDDFTSHTGVELVIVLFLDDLDKLQHHQVSTAVSNCSTSSGEILLKFFESLKYVLLTVEHASVLMFLSMDHTAIAAQLEHSSRSIASEASSMVPPPPTGSWSIPVWGYEYLDKHIIDMPYFLPQLNNMKVQHYLPSSILPSHEYMIQNTLRSVYGLLTHLNSLDIVAVEFFNVEFLEDLALVAEEERLFRTPEEASDDGLEAVEDTNLPETCEEEEVERGNDTDLSKAQQKVDSLNDIRDVTPKEHFQRYFYGNRDSQPQHDPNSDNVEGEGGNNDLNTDKREEGSNMGAINENGVQTVKDENDDVTFTHDEVGREVHSKWPHGCAHKKKIKKKVYRAKTLRTELNRLNDSWRHMTTAGGNDIHASLSAASRQSGIVSFLIATGRLLTKEISDTIDLYEADVPEGIELFCTALTKIMLSVRITFRFTAVPSRAILTPANYTPDHDDEEDSNIWTVAPFREVKRRVVDSGALKNVVMKDANGNVIDMSKLTSKNFMDVNNHGRIQELTPLEMKKIKSDVVKQVKRREIVKAKKRDLFANNETSKAEERAWRRRLRKAIKFILFIEWSSCGRYLIFASNDGVVAVVDFYTHMERVATEFSREDKTADPTKDPVNIKISCMSLSPSTSYLAVGGVDGRVAIYDSTSNWQEIQLLDFSSENDVSDSRAPKQVKITALAWSSNSNFLIIGDNRGNIFLVTTVGRVAVSTSVASSDARSSAIVEMQLQLPSDEPPPKFAWRVVKALFNRRYSYSEAARRTLRRRRSSAKSMKKDKNTKVSDGKGTDLESSRVEQLAEQIESDNSDNDDGYNELRLDPLEAVTCLRWSANMSYFISGRKNGVISIYLYDKECFGEKFVKLVGHRGSINCIAIAHSDNWLVSGSEDSTLRIWNVTHALKCVHDTQVDGERTRKAEDEKSLCVSVLVGHVQKVTGVSITPSDRYVMSCAKDGSIILWNLETGEKHNEQQDRSVMSMSISADMQLLAQASDVDGTLRVARIESNVHTRFVGTALHSVHEALNRSHMSGKMKSLSFDHDSIGNKSHATEDKNKFVEVIFNNIDSTCLMAHVTHDQLAVLSHMNAALQPFLSSSSALKMKRIVQTVHLINRWTASKRMNKIDARSIVQSDPRWDLFSLKVAQWVYLCEYYPYRISLLVQCLILKSLDRNVIQHRVSDKNGEVRMCDFYHGAVESLLYSISSAEALVRLDGPAEAFAPLIAATPSAAVVKNMFVSTFQQKFISTSKSSSLNDGERNCVNVDLSNITCRDVLSTVHDDRHDVVQDEFQFSLLECTFTVDPKLRSLISVELAEMIATSSGNVDEMA